MVRTINALRVFCVFFFFKFDMHFYSNIHVYPPTFYGMPYENATRQWSFRIRGPLNYSGCKGIYQLNYGTSINNLTYISALVAGIVTCEYEWLGDYYTRECRDGFECCNENYDCCKIPHK